MPIEYDRIDSPWLSDDDRILLEAKRRFKQCQDWEATARTNFEYDYKFVNGDSVNNYQWDQWVVGDRQDNERPCLTINKTMQHCLQIINDGKQNKPGVNIRPVGDTASFEAAQIYEEVVRHIEYISNAETIYDKAQEFQVYCGIGYWRIIVDWASEDGPSAWDQEIFLKPIKDPRSVYLDPDIDEYDGSDANFGFIFSDKARDLYEIQHPKFKDVGNATFNDINDGWYDKNHVRVAEYFRKVNEPDSYVRFTLPETEEVIQGYLKDLPKEAKAIFKEIKLREGNLPDEDKTYREKSVIRGNVEWYKIAGNKIIARKPWLGKYIPIIRIIGQETVIDGKLDRKGHVRPLLDPQRIYNVNSPLALSTSLPTPNGWTTMGEVKQGDWLLDENGKPVEVVGTSPIFINRDCYKVSFDDGTHIIADADHLWTTEEREKIKTYNWTWPVKTVTTKELVPNKHFIYATKPIELEDKNLPIAPYVLGAWLGDGTSASAQFTAGAEDLEEMRLNISECGHSVTEGRVCKHGAYNFTVNGLRWKLSQLNLLRNKHIPKEYLRASKEQRLELLRGLLDTDGCYSLNNNRCIFTNTNMRLLEDVQELLRSLGIRFVRQNVAATSRLFPNGKIYDCIPGAHISFTIEPEIGVFKLKRKLYQQTTPRIVHKRRSKRHRILSVEKVASVPVKCVSINSESHLFLAGEGMIPTHNSANVEYGALQSKSPLVAPIEAIEGHEEYYKTFNTANHSVIPYNGLDDEGNQIAAPQRLQPPQPSAAYVQQMQIAQNEMMMVTGQYQAQMGENENAKSGVAIGQRQRQGDRATFHFVDGQSVGIRYTGKQLIDLIPKVYTSKRVMNIRAKDNTLIKLTIDPDHEKGFEKNVIDGDDPNKKLVEIIFNPNVGEFAVISDTGPSFATRRQEAFNALMQIAAQNKEFMGIAGDVLWNVADFPEAQVLAERWRKIIPPNISGDAPNPQLTAAMEAAAQQIEQQLATIAKMQQQLDDKNREITVKERQVALQEANASDTNTMKMVQEIRDDYKAITERITSLGNAGPGISLEQIQEVIKQTLAEALQSGREISDTLPGPHEGGTPIEPEPVSNAATS